MGVPEVETQNESTITSRANHPPNGVTLKAVKLKANSSIYCK